MKFFVFLGLKTGVKKKERQNLVKAEPALKE